MSGNTLQNLLINSVKSNPEKIIHWMLGNDGQWISISSYEFNQQVIRVAQQLRSIGIHKNHVVAIMAGSGQDWELIHHAILLLGGIVVGIDPGETAEQLEEIIGIAGICYLLIDRSNRLYKVSDAAKNNIKSIVVFDETAVDHGDKNLTYIDVNNKQIDVDSFSPDIVNSDDIATIIFTSGTTGVPKGIIYSHGQIISAINAILEAYPELSKSPCNLVCWLPLSNLFQRIVNLCAIASGAEVYFVEQPQKVIDYLPKINPHIFIAVPRFYEKLNKSFEDGLNQLPKLVAKFLKTCLKAGESDWLISGLFRRINFYLFRSFTRLFGNNICYMVSGSAPMPIWLLKRFNALGLLVLEAYGLSENVIPIAANRSDDYLFGSVGKVLLGNAIILADDGELMVKGPGVYTGYLGDELHQRRLDGNGYLPTGDYAEIDAQGFIRLIGRKSDVFKTSTGRKIAPVTIEALLQKNPMVQYAVVFGESKKFLIALIAVGERSFDAEAEMLEYVQALSVGLSQSVSELPDYKRPVGIVLCFKSFSVERQELTANLKLRRKIIQQRYNSQIDALYALLDKPETEIHYQPVLSGSGIVLCKL